MTHGIEAYFIERARCARRVSLIALGLGVGGCTLLLAGLRPEVQRALAQTARFGYEGETQYVRRITLLQTEASSNAPHSRVQAVPRIAVKGGSTKGTPSRLPTATPVSRPRLEGPGDAEADMISRAITRMANVPVMRSEELVIDHLVRPDYPQALLDNNVEGKVTVQALVDTVGTVIEVQVMASTGQHLFERAAEQAVWQCRFRPYRASGEVSEVYALFRFAFTIY